MGALLSIVTNLVSYIRDFGGDVGECIYRLSLPEGRETLKTIANLAANNALLAKGIYRVLVDYSLTLPEMIAAGKYDKSGTIPDYQIKGFGRQLVDIELWRLIESCHDDKEALAELHKMKPGYRFATLPELLALGAAYPNLQLLFMILSLGSVWPWSGDKHHLECACLNGWSTSGRRFLGRCLVGLTDRPQQGHLPFEGNCLFAIVKEIGQQANVAANVVEFKSSSPSTSPDWFERTA